MTPLEQGKHGTFHDLDLVFEKIIDCNFESAHVNEELYIYGSKQFLN